MKTLALEFSSPQRSVAVFDPTTGAGCEAVETATGPAMKPFTLIESVLREAGLEREQIECLAVGLGPGSYTGIRAAIALVQGWHLACAVKLLGLSSAESVAAEALASGVTGMFNVIIDAQRGEFYLAGYNIAAGSVREVSPLKIVPGETLRERERSGEVMIGPEIAKGFPSRRVFPRAATLAKLAVLRSQFIRSEELTPIYLRETTFVKAPLPRPISFPSAP